MTDAIERPDALRINAWTGEDAPTQSLPKRTPWAQDEIVAERTAWLSLLAPVDDRSWKPPEVGRGLVLPHRKNCRPPDLATADAHQQSSGCSYREQDSQCCGIEATLRKAI